MRLGVSPVAASTPTGVFHQRFEALVPHAGALGCVVCFTPPPFLPIYLCANVGLQGLLAGRTACPVQQSALSLCLARQRDSSQPRLPVSTPPTSLGECFFISLVVRLLYNSIFSGCFFVFKFFWLCEEAQCVYLCLHLGRKSDVNTLL